MDEKEPKKNDWIDGGLRPVVDKVLLMIEDSKFISGGGKLFVYRLLDNVIDNNKDYPELFNGLDSGTFDAVAGRIFHHLLEKIEDSRLEFRIHCKKSKKLTWAQGFLLAKLDLEGARLREKRRELGQDSDRNRGLSDMGVYSKLLNIREGQPTGKITFVEYVKNKYSCRTYGIALNKANEIVRDSNHSDSYVYKNENTYDSTKSDLGRVDFNKILNRIK